MTPKDELKILEQIDGELRFEIDLKKLSMESLETMANNMLLDDESILLEDSVLENIAKECGFDSKAFKKYYSRTKNLKIKSTNRSIPTDEEMDRSIKNYGLRIISIAKK